MKIINKEIICTGNNGNGCFMDSCGHNCGCEGLKEFAENLRKKDLKMEITEQYSVNDGEYTDYSPYECIQYMLDDMDKEDIIGYKLNILKLERCIDDKTIDLMKDILYSRCEDRFDENDWLDNELESIFKLFEKPELFFDSGEYYTITEDDYEEVVKDM